jgi:glycosyltransferase involved in cell wall biosynthesis
MTDKPPICILAPVHPYYDIRVFQKEAKSLAMAGYPVRLLARAEDALHEDGVDVDPLQYKARWQRFLMQPLFLWKILASRARVVHLHNPDTLPIGFLLKLLGKRVIYDTHENYRLLMTDKEWINPVLRRPLAVAVDALERLAGRVLDQVIVTQTDQADHFGEDTVVIENPPISRGPLIEEAYRLAERHPREDFLRACYVGLIKEDRGLFEMVEAMERLNRTTPARLWLMGKPVSDDLIERAKAMPGWQFVDYLGIVPQADAYSHIIASDVGLAVYLPWGDNDRVNINKLFESPLFGRPIVASDFEAWREDLAGADCGLFIDPNNIDSLVEALRWIAEHRNEARAMGERGQRFIREQYNWELESQKLLAIYERLAA